MWISLVFNDSTSYAGGFCEGEILFIFLEPARRSPAALMYAISKLSYWYLLYHGNPHVACSGERSAQPQQVAKAAPTAAEDSYNQLT